MLKLRFDWYIIASIKLEGILLEYKSEHFFECVGWYRSFFFIECFVCFAYSFNLLFLRDVGVQADDIQSDYK